MEDVDEEEAEEVVGVEDQIFEKQLSVQYFFPHISIITKANCGRRR